MQRGEGEGDGVGVSSWDKLMCSLHLHYHSLQTLTCHTHRPSGSPTFTWSLKESNRSCSARPSR